MEQAFENERARLKAKFERATSAEEMEEALKKMYASGLFDESQMGMEWFQLSNKLAAEGKDENQFISQLATRESTGKEAELKQAFYAAKSADAMIKAFQNMEPHITEDNLGMQCYHLIGTLFDETKDWNNMLFYGKRAYKYFIARERFVGSFRTAVMVATTTRILGTACHNLGMFDESLSYLTQSLTSSILVESEPTYPNEVALDDLLDVHNELALLKASMGRKNEAVVHLRKVLEIQDKKTPDASVEIGKDNNGVADLYLEVGNFKEALPFLLKTVEIYGAKRLANNSVKLPLLRKSLRIMYCEMKEYGKELDHIGSSASGLKLVEEMEVANKLLVLGKFEAGEGAMKEVISQAIAQGADFTRASASVALARELCNKGKFGDAKKYLKIAHRIVVMKQIDPVVLATVLENSLKMYKEMGDVKSNGDKKTNVEKKSCDHEIVKMLEAFGFNADGTIGGVVKEMRDRASGGDSS